MPDYAKLIGPAIGGTAGALAGTLLSRKNKTRNGIVGALAGAGLGYGVGALGSQLSNERAALKQQHQDTQRKLLDQLGLSPAERHRQSMNLLPDVTQDQINGVSPSPFQKQNSVDVLLGYV